MELKKEYMGEMIHSFKDSDFGEYVITGIIAGGHSEKRIGKLVQVRLEAGEWGSDIVLLRLPNTELARHENQSFFRIPERFKTEMDELFDDVLNDPDPDIIGQIYTLGKEFPETGFIIPSKIKDGESTSMRDIKNKLCHEIGKHLENINQKGGQ